MALIPSQEAMLNGSGNAERERSCYKDTGKKKHLQSVPLADFEQLHKDQ